MKLLLALLTCSVLAAPTSAQDATMERAASSESALEGEAPVVVDDAAEREARLRCEAGWLARSQGRLEDALEDFQRAHALAPSLDRLWSVAEVLEALRRDREVLDAYRAYVELAPESDARLPEVRARVAVLERTLDTAPEHAEPEADEAAAIAPAHEHSVLDEPWFWAVVAIAGAGLIAGLLFGTASAGVEAPLPGDEGVIVRTLVELP